tara:strand:- start:337 stop:1293 length:957 start_codon:yes stop_codon:yes gene_type:complete
MGAAAVAQLVPLVATTGMSFYQMAQAKKSAEAGRKKFDEGVQKTRDLLEQNVMEELNVNDEATRLKGQQNLAALQQLTDATAGAGQRAVLGATPGLMTAADAANEAERANLQQRLEAREKAILGQDEVNRQGKMDLELDIAAVGKEQQLAEDARRQEMMGQALTGLGNIASAGISSSALYKKDGNARRAGRFVDSLGKDQLGGLSRGQATDAIMEQNYDRRTLNNARRGGFVPDEDIFANYRMNLAGAKGSTGNPFVTPPSAMLQNTLTPQTPASPFDIGGPRPFFIPPTSLGGTELPGMSQAQGYFPQTQSQILGLY